MAAKKKSPRKHKGMTIRARKRNGEKPGPVDPAKFRTKRKK